MEGVDTVPDKTSLQDYRLIFEYKPTSLPTIVRYLELTCGSGVASGTTKYWLGIFSVFLWYKKFKHENKILSNTKKKW